MKYAFHLIINIIGLLFIMGIVSIFAIGMVSSISFEKEPAIGGVSIGVFLICCGITGAVVAAPLFFIIKSLIAMRNERYRQALQSNRIASLILFSFLLAVALIALNMICTGFPPVGEGV